jgi:hypothetical protein
LKTIVSDNTCTFFKTYGLQCDNFHHEHGGSGKGHFNSGAVTNIVNDGLRTPPTYFGNLIEKKNNRVKAYGLQCDNFHHRYGGSGKGHFNSGSGTNIVNDGLCTPATYFGNLIEQKNIRVRLLEDMMSGEFQSVKTDAYVGDD